MGSTFSGLRWHDAIIFLRGIQTTLSITLISLVIGTVLGALLGLQCCSKKRLVSKLPYVFIEPLRNSPLVAQLFLIYYGLPIVFNIVLNSYQSSIIALSLNTAAFFAVLVCNSIKAIPRAQWEAGFALGYNKTQVFIYIIMHQAVRLLIPQGITLYIAQLQCSSLVSLVGLMDLARAGVVLTTRTLMPFAVWGIVFVLYYVLSAPLTALAKHLEAKLDYSY